MWILKELLEIAYYVYFFHCGHSHQSFEISIHLVYSILHLYNFYKMLPTWLNGQPFELHGQGSFIMKLWTIIAYWLLWWSPQKYWHWNWFYQSCSTLRHRNQHNMLPIYNIFSKIQSEWYPHGSVHKNSSISEWLKTFIILSHQSSSIGSKIYQSVYSIMVFQ